MRGVETRIQEIRHAVFTEVAKMAYEEGPVDKKIEALPYKIIPGETGNFEWQWACHIEEQQNQHQYLMELWKQISQKVTTLHHSLM